MRYVYPDRPLLLPREDGCRVHGHTWPRLQQYDRLRGTVTTRRMSWWKRLLNRPDVCRRCGMRRYAR